MSPAIRDGRGKLTVHDMTAVVLATNPPGPVERVVEPSVVAPKRLDVHDYAAASRRRGAERAGFVKGAKKTSGPPPVSGAAPATHKGPPVGFKRSPEVRERMRLAQLARYAKARGETPAPPAVEAADDEARNGTGNIPLADMAAAVDRALNPDFTPRAPEGEDRCSWGGWLGTTHLSVCDRPAGHAGEHRGRLFRVGVTAGTCEPFGHLAVAE